MNGIGSDPSAFLRAIAAAPRDDGPRLLYADYLDECGEASEVDRAEFIRLQIALARLPADHPRRVEFTERQNDFLLKHYDEWTESVRHLASGYKFRRGFLDSATVTAAAFLERGPELLQRTPIRRIRFFDVGDLLEALAESHLLEELREIVLCGCDLGNGGVNRLLRTSRLERLESLDLSFNGIGDGGVSLLAATKALPRLRALHLNSNRAITSVGATELASSSALGGLRLLELSANDIGEAGMAALAQSAALKELRTLGIRANPICDGGLAALAKSPLLERMLNHSPRLELPQNTLGSPGLRALAESELLNRATLLDLSGNQITDEGLIALVESEFIGKLKKLILGQNRIGDFGAIALARSPLMQQLTHIDLGSNRLSRRGIDELWKQRGRWTVEIECARNQPTVASQGARSATLG